MSDRFSAPPSAFGMSRATLIAGSVVVFHVVGLWALQSGLLRKTAEAVIPVEVLAQIIDPPVPPVPPPPPSQSPSQSPPALAQRQVTKAPPLPRPQAIREPRPVPAPDAPVAVSEPPPPAPSVPAPPAPTASLAPAMPSAPATPTVERLAEGDVGWVRKPETAYPAMSRRLNESGTVIVSADFNNAGSVTRAVIEKSSGFERLDRAAMDAVRRAQITPLASGTAERIRRFPATLTFALTN